MINLFLIFLHVSLYGKQYANFFLAGIMIQSIFWNQDHNILAGIQETTLTVWCYPAVIFVDRRLLRRSTLIRDTR